MRPLTFRAQFTMNALTVLIVVLLMLSTNTFASSGFTVMGQIAPITTINYQGRLTNRGGVAISANTPMVFRLYAAPTGGSALWTETRSGSNAVPVTNGIFSVLLGSVSPMSVDLLSRDLWLGIAVNGDPEMTPREKIGSVPYAARAGSVVDGAITSTKQTITTYHSEDNRFVDLQGQARTVVSDFKFENVPAGNIAVFVTMDAWLQPGGSRQGAVALEIQGTRTGVVPTHQVSAAQSVDGGLPHTQITLHGQYTNFSGGTLSIQVVAAGDTLNTHIGFGAGTDERFGRHVTVLAGL